MSTDGPKDSPDETFGANLRALRERNEISQPELARRMAERGWPWHQSTVYRTESGRQPLKLGEAVDLAKILGVTTDRLAWTGPEANEREMAAGASARLRGAWRDAALAVARLEDARDAAARTAERAAKSAFPRVTDAARGIGEDLADCTIELALAEADRVRERDREGES
jgi:transcriptional regulator with XRE-family HTH domain